MGCIKYNILYDKPLQCECNLKYTDINIQSSFKPISSQVKLNKIEPECNVTSQEGVVVNTFHSQNLNVTLSVDVTDIYVNIYQNCRVFTEYEDFIVEGMTFKFIDNKIFRVLKP